MLRPDRPTRVSPRSPSLLTVVLTGAILAIITLWVLTFMMLL